MTTRKTGDAGHVAATALVPSRVVTRLAAGIAVVAAVVFVPAASAHGISGSAADKSTLEFVPLGIPDGQRVIGGVMSQQAEKLKAINGSSQKRTDDFEKPAL